MRRAFTIIELLIVVFIISMVAFMPYSAFRTFFAVSSLDNAAIQVEEALFLAKYSAASRSGVVDVRCEGNSIETRVQKPYGASFELIRSSTLNGKSFFVSPVTFRFAPSSFPVVGYTGTAQISCGRSKTKKVVVSAAGRIRIE